MSTIKYVSHSLSQNVLDELLLLQPGMLQALRRRCPYNRVVLEHWQQKVGELLGLYGIPIVLLHQHIEQTPRLQFGNVPQAACSAKEDYN